MLDHTVNPTFHYPFHCVLLCTAIFGRYYFLQKKINTRSDTTSSVLVVATLHVVALE